VVGMRFDNRDITGRWVEICAYGTAVLAIPVSDDALRLSEMMEESAGRVLPEQARESARAVVRTVTRDLERRLSQRTRSAVTGALNRASRTNRPRRPADIDWNRTIRVNLRNYLPEHRTVVPERLVGYARKQQAVARDVILCLDQSGSMASSVVYAGVFGAVLAGRATRTLPVAIYNVLTFEQIAWGPLAAAALLVTAPVLLRGGHNPRRVASVDGGKPQPTITPMAPPPDRRMEAVAYAKLQRAGRVMFLREFHTGEGRYSF